MNFLSRILKELASSGGNVGDVMVMQ